MHKISVIDEARNIVKTRPVFVERHDFSATLFRDRKMTEQAFTIAAKGEYRIDFVKIICSIVLVIMWFSSLSILLGTRRFIRKRKKAQRRAAKAAAKRARGRR